MADILRKCVGCNELLNAGKMIKITRKNGTNEIFINPNPKIFGRSAYLCYNKMCIESALRKNKLEKALRTRITEDIKTKLNDIGTI